MSAIAIDHLSKSVHGRCALADVSFVLEEGEFKTLTGPKGSGKSLLLRLIAGFEEAGAGEIRVRGRRVNQLAPKDREVSLILSSNALYPHLSLYANLGFPLRLRGTNPAEIDRRARAALRAAGIAELMDRKPTTITPVQAFWAVAARAVACHPAAVLLDDPYVNFDDETRLKLAAGLREFQQRVGVSMLYAARGTAASLTFGDSETRIGGASE